MCNIELQIGKTLVVGVEVLIVVVGRDGWSATCKTLSMIARKLIESGLVAFAKRETGARFFTVLPEQT